jgi:hypothetical protein
VPPGYEVGRLVNVSQESSPRVREKTKRYLFIIVVLFVL